MLTLITIHHDRYLVTDEVQVARFRRDVEDAAAGARRFVNLQHDCGITAVLITPSTPVRIDVVDESAPVTGFAGEVTFLDSGSL